MLKAAQKASPKQLRRIRLFRRFFIFLFAALMGVVSYAFTLEEDEAFQHVVAVATFVLLCGFIIVDMVATRGIELEGGIDAISAGGTVSTGATAQAGRLFVQGEGLRLIGNSKEAERLFKEALSIYATEKHIAGMAQCHIGLADCAKMSGEDSQAVSAFDKAETLLRENEMPILANQALLAKAEMLLAKGTGTDIMDMFERIRNDAQTHQDRLTEANARLGWAQCALGGSNHDEAKSTLEQARFAFSQVGDRTCEAHALVLRGNADRDDKNYNEAGSRYERSIGLYRQCGDFVGQGLAELGLAEVRRKMDRTPDGVGLALSAASLFKRAGRRVGEGLLVSGRGDLRRAPIRFRRVRQDVEFALSLIRDQNDKSQESDMGSGLGELSRILGDLNEAQSLFEKAKMAASSQGDPSLLADVNKGLGNVNRARNNGRQAKVNYQEAHALYQQGSTRSQADILMEIGQVDFLMENIDGARVDFSHAMSFYRANNDIHGLASSLRALGDLEMNQNKIEAAIGHLAEARTSFQQVGDIIAAADCLMLIGIINVGADNAAASALLVAAARLYKTIGAPNWQRMANNYAMAVR